MADATGGAIQQQNSSSREYVVDLTLTDEGKTKFAEATQNNVGKQIAIIYDNGVLSAPRAVSYTHLDVYKRQGEISRKVGRADCGNDFSNRL